MSYIPALDQTQLGQESAWGTAVAGSSKLGLISSCEIEPEIEVEVLKDIRGSMAPGFVSVLNSHKGSASIAGVPSYDDLPYFLDSLLGTATPGASTTYTRAYTGQMLAAPTRTMYTVIKGSSGKVQKLAGAVVSELNIKIESNKPWTYTSKLLGKVVTDGSLASLSDRSQTPIHANQTSIYADAVGGTIGSTAITGIWFSLELSIKDVIGLVPKIGSLYPATYIDMVPSANLKFTADVDSVMAGYLTSTLGTSPLQQQIRIKATTGSTQIAQFDFAGVFTKSPKANSDKDGVSTLDFEMDAIYNAALGNWFKASVTNSIATMV
jgi:hypothetical protein